MKSRFSGCAERTGVFRASRSILATVFAISMSACATMDDQNTPHPTQVQAAGDLDFDSTPATPAATGKDGDLDASSEVTIINDIRYVSRKGGGTVVIESSSPAIFRTRENAEQSQVIIDIANAQLPDRLKRPYVTKDFGQQISAVNAYQDVGSSTARVVIQFKNPTHATVTQTGRRLLVLAGSPVLVQKDKDGKVRAVGEGLDDVGEISNLGKTASFEGTSSDPRILPEEVDVGVEPTRFFGRPISIEVHDSPIGDVINLIAEQSGANIVLASGIAGTTTLKLKQIPWDQALMIVMKSQGLGYTRQGSVLRIAKLADITKESDDARKVLEAQQAAEPLKVKIVPVSFADPADLSTKLADFGTKGRGKIAFDKRTNTIILTDTAAMIDRLTSMIKALDTPPLQVLIEGKIVEATDSFSRSFGIRWGNSNVPETPVSGDISLSKNNFSVSPSLTASPAGALNYNLRLGTLDVLGDLDATLALMEQEDQAKVISSPRIVIMNNEKGTISQDTTTYIAQPTTSGLTTTITYSAQQVPLSLDVTPQVTAEGDVIMAVVLKRSFLGSKSGDAPADMNNRTANTKVMVKNGQTAVIGGVYQSDSIESEQGVPWLRSIPVLGWLFKNRQTELKKNELILFLTPRILSADKSLPKEGEL